MLRLIVSQYGVSNWDWVATHLSGRRVDSCRSRWNNVLNPSLTKGKWTPEEDRLLLAAMDKYGVSSWTKKIAPCVPRRNAKQCRQRWSNHLNPELKKGHWSLKEYENLLEGHTAHGRRWAKIALLLPGRSQGDIKNVWYSFRTADRLKEYITSLKEKAQKANKSRKRPLRKRKYEKETPIRKKQSLHSSSKESQKRGRLLPPKKATAEGVREEDVFDSSPFSDSSGFIDPRVIAAKLMRGSRGNGGSGFLLGETRPSEFIQIDDLGVTSGGVNGFSDDARPDPDNLERSMKELDRLLGEEPSTNLTFGGKAVPCISF